jgi:hypothetical protein
VDTSDGKVFADTAERIRVRDCDRSDNGQIILPDAPDLLRLYIIAVSIATGSFSLVGPLTVASLAILLAMLVTLEL